MTELNPLLIEPDPIPYSFDTPGWYAIGLLLLIIMMTWGILRVIRYRKNAYRRMALKELETIANSSYSVQQKATAINRLLKQVALYLDNREAVAALTADAWLIYLNGRSHTPCFEKVLFTSVQKGQYDTQLLTNEKIDAFFQQSSMWIKTHYPSKKKFT